MRSLGSYNLGLWLKKIVGGQAVQISIVLLILTVPSLVHSQIRSGSAFLKMLPGARTQGMAESLTGSLDEMNAIYANPGAVGFLREWQWSTSYTEWIADVYNLSVMYGRRVSTPWSAQSKLALGIQYQGVRQFNSTNQPGLSAAANDLLINLSVGNPLTLISRNLSLGTNIKYFRSTLAGLDASSFMADLGLLYRFKRFKITNGFFDYGHVSAGISLSHLGQPLKFISDSTPLPRTFRAGAALNLGSHEGVQIQIATDYRKVRDEKGGLGFGTEVSWGYRVALRSGYNFNDNFLSRFSFGLSFRLDDRSSPVRSVLPGRNNAMRVDVAGVEKNEFFSTSFLGAVNVYPIGPEEFEFVDPYVDHQTRSKSITLSWQASRDPDLYDDVNYMLLIAQTHATSDGSETLTDLIDQVEADKTDLFATIEQSRSSTFRIVNSGFLIDEESGQLSYVSDEFNEGEYFWTVLAYDRDQNVRFAEKNGQRVRHFSILPILEITDIQFEHDKWITDNDYQGELHITVQNKGETKAQLDLLSVHDDLLEEEFKPGTGPDINVEANSADRLTGGAPNTKLGAVPLTGLAAGQDTTITMKWHTLRHGLHRITAQIVRGPQKVRARQTGKSTSKVFNTIPKGTFTVAGKAIAAIDTVYHYELPFISKIFFPEHSADVHVKKTSLMYSPLETLVERLAMRDNIKLLLRGHIDATIEEAEALIIERAEAVREQLLNLGVPDSLIEIPADIYADQINRQRRRTEDSDWRWVEEERRYVKITAHKTDSLGEKVIDLFQSVPLTLPKSRSLMPIRFASNIHGFVPLRSGRVDLQSGTQLTYLKDVSLTPFGSDTLTWHHYEDGEKWLDSTVGYTVALEDSLGRIFYTREQKVDLVSGKYNLLPDKIIVGVSDFTQDTPSQNLYWSQVIDRIGHRLDVNPNLSLQFVGHACQIGTHSVNDSLSVKRARKFETQFLAEVERQDLGMLGLIDARLDHHDGRGKREPFSFEIGIHNFLFVIKNKNHQEYVELSKLIAAGHKTIKFDPFILKVEDDNIRLISDNTTTFGRQINRRIEILIRSLPGGVYSTF